MVRWGVLTRAGCAFRIWAVAFSAWMGAAGCFTDPNSENDCNPGMEGCACVDLQCEQGLSCLGGVCVGAGGTSSEIDPSTAGPTTGPVDTSTGTSTSTSSSSSSASETVDTSDASTSESSTSTGDASTSSSGGEELCGNFTTDPDEECDGGNGCSDTCELEIHECNPLNNVPCPDGMKCSWAILMEAPFTAYFTCEMLEDPPLENNEGDCFVANNAEDRLCDIGLACYRATFLDQCSGPIGCCTQYCDTTKGNEQCSTAGYECTAEMDLAPGLPDLGVCR